MSNEGMGNGPERVEVAGCAAEAYRHGTRTVYRFEGANALGETLDAELTRCEGPTAQRWARDGRTDGVLASWWSLAAYVTDTEGNCTDPRGLNPTTRQDGAGRSLCFEWVLEATQENADRLLAELCARFHARTASPLAEARKERGLALDDVARAVGVTPAEYAAMEADPREMELGHALAACEALGVGIDDVFRPTA